MKTISSWNDLRPYGIDALTGEACGLMYRILFDCTEHGRVIIGRAFGIPGIALEGPWNQGSKEEPHIGSIMLSLEMLVPIAVFALLESGCKEVWLLEKSVLGIEATDSDDIVATAQKVYGETIRRRLGYRGTAGDRNIHVMTGRVE
jgi:hypothetical protein